ncbi:DUF4112 domain-containing protein [Verrucomicrobiota bacterium sgz303538]
MKKDPREIDVEVVNEPETTRPGATNRIDDPFIAFMAKLMDTAFVIPGTNIRFGLDPILGLLPGLGDTLTSLVSTVLIFQSARYGVPKVVIARMAMNVIANTAVGTIPVVGDAFSVYFKSNAKNYELLRRHAGTQRKSTVGDWLVVGGVIAVLLLMIVLMIAGTAVILSKLGDWLRA